MGIFLKCAERSRQGYMVPVHGDSPYKMKRAYVSRGSATTGQIKRNPGQEQNKVENSGKRSVSALGPLPARAKKNEILWLTENLANQWKKHCFQSAELAARNSNPEKSPAHAKEPR